MAFSGKGLTRSGKAIQQSALAQALASADCTTTAEDGSEVPCSFYDKPVRESPRSHGTKGKGMTRAEDGSWVPKSFYD
jgi:hypothetical protein